MELCNAYQILPKTLGEDLILRGLFPQFVIMQMLQHTCDYDTYSGVWFQPVRCNKVVGRIVPCMFLKNLSYSSPVLSITFKIMDSILINTYHHLTLLSYFKIFEIKKLVFQITLRLQYHQLYSKECKTIATKRKKIGRIFIMIILLT